MDATHLWIGLEIASARASINATIDAWVDATGISAGRLFRYLFLALHLSVKPELPCLLIDDPVQSMDEVHIAQFPRITWHGLRHTFCSWLAMAGATTREIMEAAGHKTMSQSARYAHLSPQHTQSVVERIVGTR